MKHDENEDNNYTFMKNYIIKVLLIFVFAIMGCQKIPLEPVSDVKTDNLKKHVLELTSIGCRFNKPGGDFDIAFYQQIQSQKISYITSELEKYGYNVTMEKFEAAILGCDNQIKGINLFATKKGTVYPGKIIELGAHYDTRNGPGADDNCSGVAGVLEIARALADVQTEKTIRFCFFDLEEWGLFGSRFHVSQILGSKEDFEGIFVFEMIGYATNAPNTQTTPLRIPVIFNPSKVGNFIVVAGNFNSAGLGRKFESSIDKYTDNLEYLSANIIGGFIGDAARSDHQSYWRRGMKGIMITDTANFRNPNYHQKTDTIETLNFDFMTKVVKATAATLLKCAEPIIN